MDFSKIPSPCFVLDEKKLRQNLQILAHIKQKTGVEIRLALKGYALWASFPMIQQYLDGCVASSLNEARLCFDAFNSRAHTYSVAFKPDEFEQIQTYSDTIIFNSLSELEKYTAPTKGLASSVFGFKNHKISYGLRLNPLFEAQNIGKHSPAKYGSRLGIDVSALKNGLPFGIEGIHAHALCESDASETSHFLSHLENILLPFLPTLKWLNIGGGHLITQTGYDTEALIFALNCFKNKYPNLQIILELGSAVVWEAGVLRAQVLDIVENKGIKTLMTDVSFVAHLPDVFQLDFRPKIRFSTENTEGVHGYRIGGSSDFARDSLSEYYFEKPVNIGDTLVFDNMMAYTMVKTAFLNNLKHPSIGIWREDDTFDLVKQFL